MKKRWFVILGSVEEGKTLYDGYSKRAANKVLKENEGSKLYQCLFDESEILGLN